MSKRVLSNAFETWLSSDAQVHDYFEFPLSLNLAEFLPPDTAPELCEYALHAVVVHSGVGSGGHYYSYIRPNPAKEEWQLCNDRQQVWPTWKQTRP